MRELEGVPAHPVETPAPGRRGPHRRRTLVVAVLAAVTAAGAVTAIAVPALAMRPASALQHIPGGAPRVPAGPSSTPAALALELATAAAGADATAPAGAASGPTVEPTRHRPAPTPMGTPVPAPCNAAGTAAGSSATAVRPCPPPPCDQASAGKPSGAMPPNPCPPPPPCAYPMATSSDPAVMRACPPPPCYDTTTASADPAIARPCPPPPCNAASTNPSGPPAMVVRPCPPPPCEATPAVSTSGAMAPRPGPCPPPSSTVFLTEGDNGRTVTVHAGTRILVRLSGGGTTVWTAPHSSDGSVVTEVASQRDAQGDAGGEFRAAAAGRADLGAAGGPHCPGAMRCPMYMRPWTVHIIVLA